MTKFGKREGKAPDAFDSVLFKRSENKEVVNISKIITYLQTTISTQPISSYPDLIWFRRMNRSSTLASVLSQKEDDRYPNQKVPLPPERIEDINQFATYFDMRHS
ncbi:hypothetical protein RJ640_005420 [Escallonia rubra]|uniref:Ycf2 N-terminal domain-containing protein n=1 Tax=Escallonia rubra TaxID=112253 RepID=A0AA88QN43_9ASTE|nr:hypothetical protein RJ640_005420 [Escallonia rubra]